MGRSVSEHMMLGLVWMIQAEVYAILGKPCWKVGAYRGAFLRGARWRWMIGRSEYKSCQGT